MEYVMLILLGANPTTNGPALMDGFETEALCERAGSDIVSAYRMGVKGSMHAVVADFPAYQ